MPGVPGDTVGLETAHTADVPVGAEHRERGVRDPDRHAVGTGQASSRDGIQAFVLAGLDLVPDDPGEFDVLG